MSSSSDTTYDTFSYKILAKKTESPTIMIIAKNATPPYILKVWSAADASDKAKGMDYEKEVYDQKINPLLHSHPFRTVLNRFGYALPLLNYIGTTDSTVDELRELVIPAASNPSPDAILLFLQAMYIFTHYPNREFTYTSRDIFATMAMNPTITESKLVMNGNVRVKSIMLPLTQFNTLEDMIEHGSTTQLVSYTKQLVIAINAIYVSKLVHNDLHAGNVMIKNLTDYGGGVTTGGDVLLYDWDRAYMDGKPNPQLDTDRCNDQTTSKMCWYSQCNLYDNTGMYGYSTDLYKVLHYILTYRQHDYEIILERVFGIYNTTNEPNKHEYIRRILGQNPFFHREIQTNNSTTTCTYLQYPDANMTRVYAYFGSIQSMYRRVSGTTGLLLDMSERQMYTVTMIAILAIVAMLVVGVRGNSSFGFTKVSSRTNTHVSSSSDINRKINPNLNISKNMSKDIKRLEQTTAAKATYADLFLAQSILSYLKFGENIPSTQSEVEGTRVPDSKPLYEIIEENNIRKYSKITRGAPSLRG